MVSTRNAPAPRTLIAPRRSLPGVPALPPSPRELARSFAGRAELWRPLVRFATPRFHARLATGPDWEAWLLTWLPGQFTGLHDHGGSSGAFAVLAGEVDEDVPLRRASGATRLSSRRYRAGQIRAFGSDHVHDVGVRGGRPAATLHVYAPRLELMTRYELVDGALRATSSEREGVDW